MQRDGQPRENSYGDDDRSSNSGPVPCDKLRCAITHRVFAGEDWKILQMAADILGELLDRRVAPLRFLAQGHENNIVKIAVQPFAQLLCRMIGVSPDGTKSLRVAEVMATPCL